VQNNIGLFLSKRAHLSPGLEAYVDSDSGLRLTYPELNARCNRTANALSALGIGKGDRVALLMMNSPEFIESFFAIAKLGAVIVPINWRLVPDELAFILKDSGSKLLIYGGEFASAVADLHGRGPEGTHVTNWLQVGGDSREDFARSYEALQQEASADEPEIGASDDDILYIMYTSGTTGLPKGAVHTHNTSIWACITMGTTAEVRLADRYLVALPLFHVGALTPVAGNVHRGVTNIVMRAFDPVKCWELIEREKITTGLAVPAMLNFMRQVYDTKNFDHGSLRWIMSGAAPVPVTLIEEFAKLDVEIHQVYGLTETCGPACLIGPEDAMAKAGSTGKAFFHTDVRVVNEAGGDVAPGEPGEVVIRGAHIMREYWNRPEATAETIRDGWLYSGDVAVIDDEGFIFIQDRTKDMIISGGENVYPAEIENVILGNPKVSEVAVIGQQSPKWGESPLAVVVKADDTLREEEVLDYCKGKLARFKLPKAVRFIDEIPRNPTGKVLKRVLRDQFPEPAAE
jgi:O-succinylbenzoate-CoA ligase